MHESRTEVDQQSGKEEMQACRSRAGVANPVCMVLCIHESRTEVDQQSGKEKRRRADQEQE